MLKKLVLGLVLFSLTLPTFAATYTATINGDMCDRNASSAVAAVKKAHRGDTVVLTITTYGGSLSPYWAIKNNLDGERLVIKVPRVADSAGSFTLMLAHVKQVSPGAEVIFHTGHMSWPDGSQTKFSVYHPSAWVRQEAYRSLALMKPYRHMFTSREWETLRTGEDVRVSASRINNT